MEQAWNELKAEVLEMRGTARSRSKYNAQTAVLDVVIEKMAELDETINTDDLVDFDPNRKNLGVKGDK